MKYPILATALLTLPLASFASAEDLTIVYKTSGPGGDQVSTQMFTANRARFNSGTSDTIIDFAGGKLTTIDHKKKEVSEITFADMEKAMASMSAEMEKSMAGLPPGLRDKIMGDAAKEVTVTKGETRTVAGISCQDTTIALGENTRMTSCNATSITPPFDPANFSKLSMMQAPMARAGGGFGKIVEKLKDIRGFSLASTTSMSAMGRKMQMTMEATEVKKGPVAPSAFDLPQGYKTVASPFAKMAK